MTQKFPRKFLCVVGSKEYYARYPENVKVVIGFLAKFANLPPLTTGDISETNKKIHELATKEGLAVEVIPAEKYGGGFTGETKAGEEAVDQSKAVIAFTTQGSFGAQHMAYRAFNTSVPHLVIKDQAYDPADLQQMITVLLQQINVQLKAA